LVHDELNQVSIFTGRAVLTRGTMVMRGTRIEMREDADGYQFGVILPEANKRAFFRQKREGNDEFMEGEAARIEFDHRKTFNDELLGDDLAPGESPVTFFTEKHNGKLDEPIELPAEAYQVDPLQATITYDLNLFPETPAYAVGSIPLFLASIEKKTISAQQLPKGLELKGNALIVDQKLFPSDAWRFYAKDDSGQYLKEILAVSHGSANNGPALFDVHYFYGQPSHLESYQRSELNPVEYGFEVKLEKAEPTQP